MPTPFREEHQHFRKTVRQFCEKELAPHVEEWERDEIFPNWVFKKAGDLGILGAHYPEEVGGGGGDYWFSVVKSEELPRCLMAGVSMGLLVQADMATPVIYDLGTKEQHEEFLAPAIRGDKIAALGVSEPNAGSDVAGIPMGHLIRPVVVLDFSTECAADADFPLGLPQESAAFVLHSRDPR